MKREALKKIMVFALMLVLIFGVLPNFTEVSAASKPKTPKITVTASDDETSITVAIGKTKRADGYQIVATLPDSDDFTEVKLLEENGKKKRSFTLENLSGGTYSIKVRGYKNSKGKQIWGKYSEVQTLTIEGIITENSDDDDEDYDYDDDYDDDDYDDDDDEDYDYDDDDDDYDYDGDWDGDEDEEDDEDYDDWECGWIYDDVVNPTEYLEKKIKKLKKAKKGDIIQFGSYEQDDDPDNGKEPIDWIVLEKTKKEIFVVSLYAVDCIAKGEYYNNDWETCTLRKWLNDTFYNTAFSKSEKKKIKECELDNKTKDKVFLLSYDDVTNTKYGFSNDETSSDIYRRASSTDYADSKTRNRPFIGEDESKTIYGEDSCSRWVLRTGSEYSGLETWVVCGNGSLDSEFKIYWTAGVRPAIKISLK